MTSTQIDALILAIARGSVIMTHTEYLAAIPPLARPCSAGDMFTVLGGLQCGNCLYPNVRPFRPLTADVSKEH